MTALGIRARARAAILAGGPQAASSLRLELRCRYADLLAVLHAEPCFRQVGGPRKSSRWGVVEERLPTEAVKRWGHEITEWMIEEGLAVVEGGRLVPTEAGLELSHGLRSWREGSREALETAGAEFHAWTDRDWMAGAIEEALR